MCAEKRYNTLRTYHQSSLKHKDQFYQKQFTQRGILNLKMFMWIMFLMLALSGRMDIVTGQKNMNPVLDKINDMSLDIVNLQINALQIERDVLTELGLARKYLTSDLMTNLVPSYIDKQVQSAVTDIFKSRSSKDIMSDHLEQKLQSLTRIVHQLKRKFHMMADEFEGWKIYNQSLNKKIKKPNSKSTEFDSQLSNLTSQQEDLSEKILQLQAEMSSNRQTLTAMGEENKQLKQQLKQLLARVQSHDESLQDVTYQVRLRRDTSFPDYSTLNFDDVMYNRGNAYENASGVFTVPVSGTYLLWAHIMRNNNYWMSVQIKLNNMLLLNGYTTTGPHRHGVASITGAADLKKGERITVSAVAHGGYVSLRGDYHSSYGGTLLKVN